MIKKPLPIVTADTYTGRLGNLAEKSNFTNYKVHGSIKRGIKIKAILQLQSPGFN